MNWICLLALQMFLRASPHSHKMKTHHSSIFSSSTECSQGITINWPFFLSMELGHCVVRLLMWVAIRWCVELPLKVPVRRPRVLWINSFHFISFRLTALLIQLQSKIQLFCFVWICPNLSDDFMFADFLSLNLKNGRKSQDTSYRKYQHSYHSRTLELTLSVDRSVSQLVGRSVSRVGPSKIQFLRFSAPAGPSATEGDCLVFMSTLWLQFRIRNHIRHG